VLALVDGPDRELENKETQKGKRLKIELGLEMQNWRRTPENMSQKLSINLIGKL